MKNTKFIKNSVEKYYSQKKLDKEIIRISRNTLLYHSIIVILFKGEKLPKYCIPMPQNPIPKINIPLKNNFANIYFSAIKKNPQIKDGAIFIQVGNRTPILRGFSYRLYPPPMNVTRLKNMGSGYNSSLDFSGVSRIVCVYFINRNGVKKFINGKETYYIKKP